MKTKKSLCPGLLNTMTAWVLLGCILFLIGCPSPSSGSGGGTRGRYPPAEPNSVLLNIRNVTASADADKAKRNLANWDYYFAGKDMPTMVFNVDEDSWLPTELYVRPDKDSDKGFGMSFNDKGQPEVMEYNGYDIYFFNYDGYQFDMAVVLPNGEVEYHYSIETDTNWDTFSDKILQKGMSSSRSLGRAAGPTAGDIGELALEIVSQGLAIASCVLVIYFPPAAMGCILNIASGFVKTVIWVLEGVVGPEWAADAFGLGVDIADLVLDVAGCVEVAATPTNITKIGRALDCISGVATLASMAVAVVKMAFDKKETVIIPPVPETVIVNFYANDNRGKTADKVTIEKGSYVKLPEQGDMVYAGHTFKGWSTSPGTTSQTSFAYRGGEQYPHKINKDTSFYGVWDENSVRVSAEEVSAGKVKVSWTAPADSVDYYRVWRSETDTSPGAGGGKRINKQQVGTVNPSKSPSYTDSKAEADTGYHYTVAAVKNGISRDIGEVYVKTAVKSNTPGTTPTPGTTTYTATANDAGNTTAINLNFSAAVSGLTANDITVTNGTGSVTKGALTGSGKSYSLGVTVNTAGNVTVKIAKSGIESGNKTVAVSKGTTTPGTITYTATANNESNTTAINLNFSAAVSGLTANDITVTNGTGSVTKGALTGSGTSYSLEVTVDTAGDVTVKIDKSGIESGNKTVAVGKGTSGTITYTATANNESNTTAINLNFSAAVSGLTANDITVTNGTGSVSKGALTGSGTSYSLGVTVATAGNITVSIAKSGIESGNKTVTVSIATEGLEYTLINSGSNRGTYRVRKGTVTGGAVFIPAVYNGLPVTEIGNDAFDSTSITSVNIPASVTSIGYDAFYRCFDLTGNINIPAGVTTIGDSAFYNCAALTSVTFAAGSQLASIGDNAFYFCDSLTSINIPAGVTSIGEKAFYYCKITSINIPEVVTSIGNSAFEQCSELTGSINIPASITFIGEKAFYNCKITSVTFAAGSQLKTISNSAFYRCSDLTGNINIPASVTSIGESAFNYCSGLTNVTFQGTITSANFNSTTPFRGDLRTKYFAANGGIGTYTTTAPVNNSSVWTKQ